ncbi:unnamed protein product, partial [Prorocentrum cordatum]
GTRRPKKGEQDDEEQEEQEQEEQEQEEVEAGAGGRRSRVNPEPVLRTAPGPKGRRVAPRGPKAAVSLRTPLPQGSVPLHVAVVLRRSRPGAGRQAAAAPPGNRWASAQGVWSRVERRAERVCSGLGS